jgi:hypothetical protein
MVPDLKQSEGKYKIPQIYPYPRVLRSSSRRAAKREQRYLIQSLNPNQRQQILKELLRNLFLFPLFNCTLSSNNNKASFAFAIFVNVY